MQQYPIFYILHLLALFTLVGTIFAAIANPDPERRRPMLMYSGIASLVVMLTGFGLLGMLKYGWPGWAFVKIACWLILSMLVGLPFRKMGRGKYLSAVTLMVVAVALMMVYLKPI